MVETRQDQVEVHVRLQLARRHKTTAEVLIFKRAFRRAHGRAMMDDIKPDSQLFESYLKCPTKCWLRSRDESSHGNAYADWMEAQLKSYRAEGVRRLKEAVPESDRAATPLSRENLKAARWRLALEFEASANGFASQFEAVERVPAEGRDKPAELIPIRFSFRNKLTRDDPLLVAYDALVLSEIVRCDVSQGKIIHGDAHTALKVRTSALMSRVRKLLGEISEAVNGSVLMLI